MRDRIRSRVLYRREAGVASTFPAASLARTLNRCAPRFRPDAVNGDAHGANAALSMRHSNVDARSLEENLHVGVRSVVRPAGPRTIVVLGGVVSILKARAAGAGSALPAGSTARTSKPCAPSASAGVTNTGVQPVNGAPSRRHSNRAPASREAKAKRCTAARETPSGPAVIVVSGATVSTVIERLAGVASRLPAGSIATAWITWAPSASGGVVKVRPHAANGAPSTRHSKSVPGSSAASTNAGVGSLIAPEGPDATVVFGGVMFSILDTPSAAVL